MKLSVGWLNVLYHRAIFGRSQSQFFILAILASVVSYAGPSSANDDNLYGQDSQGEESEWNEEDWRDLFGDLKESEQSAKETSQKEEKSMGEAPLENLFHVDVVESFSNRKSMRISHELRTGSHLIYYCRKQFWACVDKSSFQQCEKWKKETLMRNQRFFSCAPLKEYNNSDQCYEVQLENIHRYRPKDFCTNF